MQNLELTIKGDVRVLRPEIDDLVVVMFRDRLGRSQLHAAKNQLEAVLIRHGYRNEVLALAGLEGIALMKRGGNLV